MRHQVVSASELGQVADAFDKRTLDLKLATPIRIATREIAVILNTPVVPEHPPSVSNIRLDLAVTQHSSNARSATTDFKTKALDSSPNHAGCPTTPEGSNDNPEFVPTKTAIGVDPVTASVSGGATRCDAYKQARHISKSSCDFVNAVGGKQHSRATLLVQNR